MAASQIEEQVTLKLLVNKESNKVLFAEAGKDFVDVLFSFLTFPLGTIARLIKKESNMGPVKLGCLSTLYESVAKFDKESLSIPKEILLQPCNSSEDYCSNLKLNIDDTERTKFFMCSKVCSRHKLSTFANQMCQCGCPMSRSVSLKIDDATEGFVNSVSKFIITDDLTVMPNSIGTSFCLLQNNCGTINTSSVQEMTVHVDKKKVLDLLKCCLLSKTTPTDLLLKEKPSMEMSNFSPCAVEDSSAGRIQLKLVTRKLDGGILFAQAEEDFVDILLSFLTLPLGRVVCLLNGSCCIGNVDGLYKSIADLNANKYFTPKCPKNRLIDPFTALQFKLRNQILPMQIYAPFYYCYYAAYPNYPSSISGYWSCANGTVSKAPMEFVYPPKSSERSHAGYAKGPAMFLVTDNLSVVPASPISVVSLLSRLQVSLSDLNEEIVMVGVKEVLNILKACLTSSSALNNGLGHLLTKAR